MKHLALILCLISVCLCSCGSQQSQMSGGPPAFPAKIAPVRSQLINETSTFVATLKCRKSVVIRPRVSGYITQIDVRSGDSVRFGTVLLEIDPAKELEAVNTQLANQESIKAERLNAIEKLRSLKAERAAKVSNLEYWRGQFVRYQGLKDQGAVSQEAVDQTSNQLRSAESDLASIDAQIRAQGAMISRSDKLLKQSQSQTKQEELELGYHNIIAPFPGTVGDIPVKLGQYVEPSTSLTTIDQAKPLEVYVYVPAEQSIHLRKGMEMKLVDSNDQTLGTCPIFFISPQVDDENQTVLVKGLYENNNEKLRSNQQVTTKIVWDNKQRLLVPTNSIMHVSGQDFVFVAVKTDKGYTVKQRPVKLGEIYDNSYIVLSGLTGHEQIVVSNVQTLFDGAPIAPN